MTRPLVRTNILISNNVNYVSKSVKMKNLKQLIRQAVPMVMMLLLCSATLHGQNINISGTVSDAAGEPLIGASVVVKGQTSLGTVTDFDGNFTLKVPSESTVLVVS